MLDAEDLVRGYCVDVWHSATKSWHPLCRRAGTYDFLTADETLVIEDEGWVSTAVSSASDGVYVEEQLFRWRGWSPVALQPGLTIDKDGLAADIQNTPQDEFQLQTDFKAAPGSLPRLRYGDSYRLRARAVATNSDPTLDELPGTTVSVAGHKVGYDEDRQLWFCDIDIDVGEAYYPFIRLALARYQPDSVDDAHLSRVVLADFAQVAPNRTVSIAFAPSPTISS